MTDEEFFQFCRVNPELRIEQLTVICGCMFAGKTARLIERLSAARVAGLSVAAFKHRLDDRYVATELASHDGRTFPATIVMSLYL